MDIVTDEGLNCIVDDKLWGQEHIYFKHPKVFDGSGI